MVWVKLDDQFFLNEKAVRVGVYGRALYVAGLCWCSTALTDGRIPREALALVAAQAGVKPSEARSLVAAGLWDETGEGFVIPDFLEFNPSREKVLADRAAAKARQAKSRSKRGVSHGVTDGVTHAVSSRAPIPSPVDDEETSSSDPRIVTALWTTIAEAKFKESTGVKNAQAWKRTVAQQAEEDLIERARELCERYSESELPIGALADVLMGRDTVLRYLTPRLREAG